MDSTQKLGRLEGVGFVHYDSGLLSSDQRICSRQPPKSGSELLHSILTLDQAESVKESSKLNYLGVEGHWKVYNFEGQYGKFLY